MTTQYIQFGIRPRPGVVEAKKGCSSSCSVSPRLFFLSSHTKNATVSVLRRRSVLSLKMHQIITSTPNPLQSPRKDVIKRMEGPKEREREKNVDTPSSTSVGTIRRCCSHTRGRSRAPPEHLWDLQEPIIVRVKPLSRLLTCIVDARVPSA